MLHDLWVCLCCYFFRLLLWFRYRIEFRGLDAFKQAADAEQRPILFLPNHSSQIDPMILFSYLWPHFKMHSIAVEYVYRLPIVGSIIRTLGGISIPNFETGLNQYKLRKARLATEQAKSWLRGGEHFLIFPSGRIKLSGKEIVGGASLAHDLVKEIPGLSIGMIRISGLWGSAFSRALTGRVGDPLATIARGIWIGCKNLVFFTPRRKIYVDFALNPPELIRSDSRVAFNQSLEAWYNRFADDAGHVHGVEPLTRISYSLWKNALPPIEVSEAPKGDALPAEFSKELTEKVYREIRAILQNPSLEISNEMRLGPDLGMDSLNIAELVAVLARSFGAAEVNPDQVSTVQSVLALASGAKRDSTSADLEQAFSNPEEPNRPGPWRCKGQTFPEAFLHVSKERGPFVAFADPIAGEMTFAQARKAVLVLAQHFKTFPETRIALMLPCCAAVYLAILALQCAGKVPVMLNWTLGSRALEQMMEASGAKRVLTSWNFIEKLRYAEFGSLCDQFVFLEDIRKSLTLKQKAVGAALALLPAQLVLRLLGQRIDPKQEMVVLFTSGTENVPKGVPLSHENVLTNIRDSVHHFFSEIRPDDAMLSMLPPFHSFGFTASGFMPLFTGLRVICYPDPTDNFAIANGIEKWRATIACSTPGFLKRLLQTVDLNKLRSLRWVFLGGEKAPPELHDMLPQAKLLEGYGVTECSPVVTIRLLDRPPDGVGQPLPSVAIRTVHPETQAPLSEGVEGELCVSGPTVFQGYLNSSLNPFLDFDEKRWYRTGDIGRVDEMQTVHVTGRLKRFIKIAGEMISLGAIEHALVEALIKEQLISVDLPALAICPKMGEKEEIVLFSTVPLDVEKANRILKESGFSRLVKINAVRQVAEIPLLGTGKTNYRQLEAEFS